MYLAWKWRMYGLCTMISNWTRRRPKPLLWAAQSSKSIDSETILKIQINRTPIAYVSNAKNLGVTVTNTLNWQTYMSTRPCQNYKSIWNFKRSGRIWNYMKNVTFSRPGQIPRPNTSFSISFLTFFFTSLNESFWPNERNFAEPALETEKNSIQSFSIYFFP